MVRRAVDDNLDERHEATREGAPVLSDTWFVSPGLPEVVAIWQTHDEDMPLLCSVSVLV